MAYELGSTGSNTSPGTFKKSDHQKWGTVTSKPHKLTQDRGKVSQAISNIKGKLKDPSFQKDVKAVATIASFLPVGGGAVKLLGKVGKFAKKAIGGKKKLPKMSAKDKKLFNPDGSSKTGDLYAGAKSRAKKPATRPIGGFRELITGNTVHNTKSINAEFAKRFGKPKK